MKTILTLLILLSFLGSAQAELAASHKAAMKRVMQLMQSEMSK